MMIEAELKRQSEMQIEIPIIIDGKEIKTGKTGTVVMPHNHKHVLATYHQVTEKEVALAIESSLKAKEKWMHLSWVERNKAQENQGDPRLMTRGLQFHF